MIAVLLAAGRGSRLSSYTDDLPKSLLPLNFDTTILDYNLDLLKRLGVQNRLIVTGYEARRIEDHVRKVPGVKCVYNPFWEKCNVLGSLFIALPYIESDFIFLHADTLVGEIAWKDLVSKDGDMVLPYKEKKCGEEEMKVMHDHLGKLVAINKTMKPESANGEFLGIAKFRESTKNIIQSTSERLFKENGLHHYVEAVIEEVINTEIDLKTFNIGDNPFIEVDFEDDYLQAKKIFG